MGSVDHAAIIRLTRSETGPVVRFLWRTGHQIRNRASIYCNVDTGRLRSSLYVVTTARPSVRVGSNVNYAVYVHEGTGPHRIYPVSKKALRWVGPTGAVYAKHADHPGYHGNPFLRDAMVEVVGAL